METELIRRYLLNKKAEIRALTIFNRVLNFTPSKNFIVTLVGARRTGKTYSVLNLIVNKLKLKDEDFIYANLEDVDLDGIENKDILGIVSIHQQIYNKLPSFICIDEPQNIKNWEKAVYSLYEKKMFNIIITGSSSKLLSKEIATSLRGRSLTYVVYPLSFGEYLTFRNIEPKSANMLSSYDINNILHELFRYLTVGSLPDMAINPNVSNKFYSDYINLVIFKDIVERFGIKNIAAIRFLIKASLTSFSKSFSINSLYNSLKGSGQKISKKTLYSYVSLLEDVFFSFYLKKFSFSKKKSELSMPKVYLNDWGVASTVLTLPSEIGRLMENAVFIELKRRAVEDKSIYYSDIGNDIDFAVLSKNKIVELIQVTYASAKDKINKREIKSLLKGSIELKCNNLLVITWDYEAEEKIKGKKIKFVPLWKWLLKV